MAYRRFGHFASDVVIDQTGRPLAGVSGDVYDAVTGGTRIVDLLDEDGNAVNHVVTAADGSFPFQAQDTLPSTLWVEFPGGDHRFAVLAADVGTRLDTVEDSGVEDSIPSDGSVTNAKVASNAAIAQSKIANLTTDLAAKADDDDVVHLTGAETVAGVKTFSDPPVIPAAAGNSNPVRYQEFAALLDAFRYGTHKLFLGVDTDDSDKADGDFRLR